MNSRCEIASGLRSVGDLIVAADCASLVKLAGGSS